MDAFAKVTFVSVAVLLGSSSLAFGFGSGVSRTPAPAPAPVVTQTATPQPTAKPTPTTTPTPRPSPTTTTTGTTPPPDFWNCTDKLGGQWSYGIVPYACDSSVYGADSYVNALYSQLTIEESAYTTAEITRYLTAAYATIRDSAAYYLKTRETNPSTDEISAWQSALYALIAQESMWSHFRNGTDGRLKITRGDSGHGFGMMQIDDRAHTAQIQSGQAWDLMGNVVLGLDIFYTGWQKAATSSCVSSATDWESRSRAAYSYYNSGSQLCRWTDSSDTWAANDAGYLQNYQEKLWSKYISNVNQTSSVNVECAIESTSVEKTGCEAN